MIYIGDQQIKNIYIGTDEVQQNLIGTDIYYDVGGTGNTENEVSEISE